MLALLAADREFLENKRTITNIAAWER